MRNSILGIIFSAILLSLTTTVFSCGSNGNSSGNDSDSVSYKYPDTLIVGTIYGPTSYFLFKSEEMGYEYELISQFAKDKGIKMRMEIAPNLDSLISLLDSSRIDIIAYEVPITSEYNKRVLHCGNENITNQVLVQRKEDKDKKITDVTQLIGKDIYVEKNSKYEFRLHNLDDELGGGIRIHPIPADTLIAEDLLEKVSEGKLPYTIIDSDKGRMNLTYYRNIDISLPVSFAQRASWAVKNDNTALADSINVWAKSSDNDATSKSLLKRYFELSKNPHNRQFNLHLSLRNGRISPYDNYFKTYAATIDWDWRLLAAQGYVESQFDTTVVSWAGAKGIMQLMPKTAEAFGLNQYNVQNPELNIQAAVKYIRSLNKSLLKHVSDPKERVLFIVASYNSGLGHVLDAIALAKKHGKNPEKWFGNVEEAILMKSNPEYFNDEVCRFGYFKGKQTVEYVAQVEKFYDLYRHKIPI